MIRVLLLAVAVLAVERVNHSLLLRWEGTGDDAPVLMAAHYDVVPAGAAGDTPWRA